jgi:hypothetical protein
VDLVAILKISQRFITDWMLSTKFRSWGWREESTIALPLTSIQNMTNRLI